MNFDGTHVDADELTKFSKGAHDRAGRTTSAADTVAGTHLGSDMLGAFSLAFLNSARTDQTEIVSKLRAVVSTLTEDGTIASTNATHVGANETTQTSRFTEKELP